MHAVVVGELPVVEVLLALLLRGLGLGGVHSELVGQALALGRLQLEPLGLVAAAEAFASSLEVVEDAEALTCEAVVADVAAPGDGVVISECVVDDAHHLVHGNVVAVVPSPVVLHLYGEAGVEGVVCVAGDAYVVVPVEAEACGEGLRSVFLAFVGERLRRLAEVAVEDSLQTCLPLCGDRLALALGYSADVRRHHAEELVEVGQRVADHSAGLCHGVLGDDAVVLDGDENVAGRAALREVAVAVHAHGDLCALHIVLVADVHFGQVVRLACLLEDLGLEEAQCAVGPACARAVLVLDAGDGQLLYYGEYGFVGFLFLRLLLGGEGGHGHECGQQHNCNLSHSSTLKKRCYWFMNS